MQEIHVDSSNGKRRGRRVGRVMHYSVWVLRCYLAVMLPQCVASDIPTTFASSGVPRKDEVRRQEVGKVPKSSQAPVEFLEARLYETQGRTRLYAVSTSAPRPKRPSCCTIAVAPLKPAETVAL